MWGFFASSHSFIKTHGKIKNICATKFMLRSDKIFDGNFVTSNSFVKLNFCISVTKFFAENYVTAQKILVSQCLWNAVKNFLAENSWELEKFLGVTKYLTVTKFRGGKFVKIPKKFRRHDILQIRHGIFAEKLASAQNI